MLNTIKCKANILLSNFGSSRRPAPENLCRPLCKNLCRRDTSINPDRLWFMNYLRAPMVMPRRRYFCIATAKTMTGAEIMIEAAPSAPHWMPN